MSDASGGSLPARDLPAQESIYRTLLTQVPGALYVAEVGWNGRWLYISPQIETLLGYPAQAWLDDSTLWYRLVHPEDRDEQVAADEPDVTQPGQTHFSEYRIRASSGELRWFSDTATLVADETGNGWVWSGVLSDITVQRDAEEGMRQSRADTAAIIETAMDAYVAVDAAGRFVSWNNAAEAIFGWSASEVIGRSLVETLVPPQFRATHRAGFARALTGTAPLLGGRPVELKALRRDGTEIDVELTLWRTPSSNGQQLSAFLRDITDRTAMRARLTKQAYHDPVTGLANRNLFTDRLERAARPSEVGSGAAVLFVDLDDFKAVNDTMGHATGDLVLADVAARLATCVREQDTLARLSGDEFAILIPDLPSPDEAMTVAHRLQDVLRAPFVLEEREWFVQASVGVAYRSPGSGTDADQLLGDADLAMYTGKREGRGAVTLFAPWMRERLTRRSQLTTQLHGAVDNGRVGVHYQPFVGLVDGAVVGVEALARWQQGDGEWIPPDEFIPLAEETGMIHRLGLDILTRACEDMVQLGRRHPEWSHLSLSVNASARQFDDPRFTDRVAEVLRTTELSAEALTLEITEGELIADSEDVLDQLSALRRLGIRIAVDDFGTRFASLAYLQRLPLDTLKIDRAFVAGVHDLHSSAPITAAIVRMARELGLRTVGEGIETAAEAAWLASRGCALGQGYHFGRPMPLTGLVTAMTRSAESDADVRFLPHVVAETSLSAER